MKISDHFHLEELVPKAIFEQYGARSKWFIDPQLIVAIEWIRTRYGKAMTINNWSNGGSFQNRGFRTPTTTVGARLSQHKFGRAADFNIDGMTSQEVFTDLVGISEQLPFTTIENVAYTPTWSHIDCRWTGGDSLLIVAPN